MEGRTSLRVVGFLSFLFPPSSQLVKAHARGPHSAPNWAELFRVELPRKLSKAKTKTRARAQLTCSGRCG